ncbi:hypothetical protein EV127DRAFT_104845 [Xylaria flabelliformis]|nr:hypothetical protein EV127DRAFT_104845 [Xylaria flabelliformis]
MRLIWRAIRLQGFSVSSPTPMRRSADSVPRTISAERCRRFPICPCSSSPIRLLLGLPGTLYRWEDVILFYRPVPYSFEGYWPEFPDNYGANAFTIAFALENPRGSQETVALRSANLLDPSDVNILIFEKGPDQDLQAMLEAGSKLRGEHEDADW